MKVRLKKIRDQVVVLTGASSGIGLVTARMAARQGARLVLAARSGPELEQLAQEIRARGGQAVPVVADVSRLEDVRRLADVALRQFGGFDTWINNAGTSLFGRLEEIPLEEFRRLFDVNFWGLVYGSLVAVHHLKRRGGAIINMGSVASDRAFPLQGMYSASKHAIKGFTDALRMELEAEEAPISVTLIKPTSIATPLPQHSGNYLNVEPTLPAPVYAPEVVAEAILHAAQHPERDIAAGGASKALSAASAVAPRLMDKYLESSAIPQSKTDRPARHRGPGILERPSHDLSERGWLPRHVFESSAYTSARMHPLVTATGVLGAALALGGIWSAVRARS